MSFLKRILRQSPEKPDAGQPDADNEDVLALKRQLQSLQMDLHAQKEQIDRLSADLERQRIRQNELVDERAAAIFEKLMNDLSSPVSQLLTQADLHDNQAKPVQAQDVLAITRRVTRTLERSGMGFVGSPMQIVAYDPTYHQPIQAGANPQPGQMVTIRFVGVTYGGKMLLKALID